MNLFTPPIGGVITSDIGGINCGASSFGREQRGDPAPVRLHLLRLGLVLTDHCGQNRFEWSQTVVLTATGQGGNAFLGWAGDC